MEWLSSEGGPLIIVGQNELINWQGVDNSDYDRACSVEDYLGLIPVGNSQALVLGDEPCQTALFTINSKDLTLVRWIYGEDELTVEKHLRQVPEELFNSPLEQVEYRVQDDEFILFDSVLNGEVASGLKISLPPDMYVITTVQYEPDEDTSLILHRFLVS